jgi:hypothetical protein
MRRTIMTGLFTSLLLTSLSTLAVADGDRADRHDTRGDAKDRDRDRGDAKDRDRDRGDAKDRRDRRSAAPRRVNRPAVRPDRHALVRQPVFVDNGRLKFGDISRPFVRPVARAHYTNRRVRPHLLIEDHGSQPGYLWVSGAWVWNNDEWRWTDGHFAPDPQYATYYDDGSYDYAVDLLLRR